MSATNYFNRTKIALTIVVVSFVCASTSDAMAQEEGDEEWNIALGGGAALASDLWTGTENEVMPVPYFDIRKGNWHFNAENLIGYRFQVNRSLSAFVGTGVRNDGYDRHDVKRNKGSASRIFDGYDEPDTEVVFNYGVTYGWLSLSASRDVSGESRSDTASLSLSIPVRHDDDGLSISTTAAIGWYDANYVNHYYGIGGEQVDDTVGRTAYRTGSATNLGLAISAVYPLSGRWTAIGILSRTELNGNIADSPLVDTDHQNAAVLLLVFQL